MTFAMHVLNNTGVALSNVAASSQTPGGSATIGVFSGPTPASAASLASGQSANFAWTAPVTGAVYQTYTVSGTASGTNGGNTYASTSATSATADIDCYILDVTSNSVNAFSTNQEMSWTIANYGCYPVHQVSLPIPAGWTWSGDTTNDAYSAVDNGSGQSIENWTAAASASNVVFTVGTALPTDNIRAPNKMTLRATSHCRVRPAHRNIKRCVGRTLHHPLILLGALKGYFYLTLKTPSTTSPTTTSFSATVTDTNTTPRTVTVSDPTPVTVNLFNAGSASPNNTRSNPGTWREQFH